MPIIDLWDRILISNNFVGGLLKQCLIVWCSCSIEIIINIDMFYFFILHQCRWLFSAELIGSSRRTHFDLAGRRDWWVPIHSVTNKTSRLGAHHKECILEGSALMFDYVDSWVIVKMASSPSTTDLWAPYGDFSPFKSSQLQAYALKVFFLK